MDKKVIVVMPAYNAEKTLERTYEDIPKAIVNEIILCDDFSSDRTVEIARMLNLTVIPHTKNMGYGANQKTCYKEALQRSADIVIMLHPDYQYDAKKIPGLIHPILEGNSDVVLGSRILNRGALKGGMPFYKYISNRISTIYENRVLGLNLSEYHTGFRAYSRKFLEAVNWQNYSDDFLFDAQILIEAARRGFRITEIPIETRYFKEASQINIFRGIKYGIGIFFELEKYKNTLKTDRFFAKKLLGFFIFLLLVFCFVRVWHYGQARPGIDFYQFWAVGQEIIQKDAAADIYSREARIKIGNEFLKKAYANTDSSRFRWAAENRKVFEIYSTPFLYSLFAIFFSGDYEADYRSYQLFCLMCSLFAIVALCRLFKYSVIRTMFFLVLFAAWFEPFFSDVRVANVNQIQLGLLALFLWFQAKYTWRM